MKIVRRIYRSLYDRSPNSLKSALTKMVFLLLKKPFVKPCDIPIGRRFPGGFKGCLVVSADFEMAWAWRYSKMGKNPVEMGLKERENIPYLVRLFEEYDFPITWATVGHLFLERCECISGRAHPRLRRIPYFNDHWTFASGDWYDHDPCSSVDEAPAWYGADLIQMILESHIEHEIGCHTFSHIHCDERFCPDDVFEDEIKECAKVASKYGIQLSSMVFPGGTNGHYDILKKSGFSNYRFNDERWDMFYPEKDPFGLWRLPSSASIGADPFNWTLSYLLNRYKKYVDAAIEKHSVLHLWFHPSIDEFFLHDVLPGILDYASMRRSKGELWCATMSEITRYVEGNEQNSLSQFLP